MTITAREIKWAVGAGMFSALIPLIAVMLMGISPYLTILVILFFPLPLYGAYLSQGPRIGSAASLIGALIGTLIGNMGFLVLYATISLPAHLLCQKAIAKTSSEQTNESQLVQWFTLFILGLCLLGCFIYTSIDSNDLSGILGQVKQQLETLSTGDSRQLETLLPFIPAILSLNVAGLHFVNGALAQGILKRKNLALSPSLSLHQVVISDIWMYALVVAGGLVLLFDGVIDRNEDPMAVADAHTQLSEIGGYSAPAKASKILVGLGFSEEMQQQPVSSYSGGWRMRVNLAAALFSEPDLLLLDEPTNHLDFESVAWLEGFLKTYPQTILMISHDRHVLNNVVNRIYHLGHKKFTLYVGNYDFYEKTQREKMAHQEAALAKQQARRSEIEGFVNRFRAKASKAKQVQSRIKMLERFEPISILRDDPSIRLVFPEPENLSPPLITLEKVKAGYGDKVILKNLNQRIDPEDRVALLGANGNGKSTFAKLLSSVIQPLEGSLQKSSKLRVGYFHQHQIETLRLEASAYDHMKQYLPELPEDRVRARLGQFGFTKDKADVEVGKLSGGEKARLNFALVSCHKPHILILDEPTNHLDMDTRDSLVFAINQFQGAVILITHDWNLLELTADTLWVVKDQQVMPFDGTLQDYQRQVLGIRGVEKLAKPQSDSSRADEIRAKKAKKKKNK